MMRRCIPTLFRRTPTNLSGGGLPHIVTAEEAPAADTVLGMFGKLNGPFASLRVIDIKWIMNRLVSLGREGYISSPVLYGMVWFVLYKLQDIVLWSDAKPPRKVDWNKEVAGKLPDKFEKTPVLKTF
eukprot:Tbor_TRINITY_DN5825_c1_g3::TRINITY_DN5825_c1_g3_i1::g.6675::m.6675